MTKPYIPLLLGTAHEGRQTEKVARYVYDQIKKADVFDIELIDVRDFLFSKTELYSAVTEPWKKIMQKADGLIIVSPEYNRGMPGELKILLDSLNAEYVKKPVAIVGVSSGKVGGARMAESMLPTLVALGMVPITPAIPFPVVQDLFDADGEILDNSFEKKISGMVKELYVFARMLKKAREDAASA